MAQQYKFDGSSRFSIAKFDCADTGEFQERHETIREFTKNLEKINEYQQKLFAEKKEGIIFVFQAMDAAGKDGAVRAVLSCLSPQGVAEHSFKVPSAEERRHDYLWRFWKAIPEKGCISILNRSYYEDVLVQKVHEIYRTFSFADRIDRDKIIENRYTQIRNFEKYLWQNSFRVIKIFLNVSRDEQAHRFISRVDTPKKNWKFSSSDIDEREYWDDYMAAYEMCINKTARKDAPWYVVPADHKWYARLLISRIVLSELEKANPQWPVLAEAEQERLNQYRAKLVLELGADAVQCEEKKDKIKIKPADTAIKLAMDSDREALKKKKLRKKLKKYVDGCLSEQFNEDPTLSEALGPICYDYEELAVAAEIEQAEKLDKLYRDGKKQVKGKLEGYGKEAKKVYSRFKKSAESLIEIYDDTVNSLYSSYTEEVRQAIMAYSTFVPEENGEDDALEEFKRTIKSAYMSYREEADSAVAETADAFEQNVDTYLQLAEVFSAAPDAKPEDAEQEPVETADTAEETPAEQETAE